MLKRSLLILFILFHNVYCFAYEKQKDEYSCGATSVYNLIQDVCPSCNNKNFDIVYKLLKTDTKGTTTYNLCQGLDDYFSEQNISHKILYYGIKKLRYTKLANTLIYIILTSLFQKDILL